MPLAWAMKSARSASKCSTVIALLLSHQTLRLGVRVAHDELVLRAASGMGASVGDEGAMRGDPRFVALQRVLVELRRAEIPVDPGQIAEAETVRAEADIMRAVLDHRERPLEGAPRARKSTPRNFADFMWRRFGAYQTEFWAKPSVSRNLSKEAWSSCANRPSARLVDNLLGQLSCCDGRHSRTTGNMISTDTKGCGSITGVHQSIRQGYCCHGRERTNGKRASESRMGFSGPSREA